MTKKAAGGIGLALALAVLLAGGWVSSSPALPSPDQLAPTTVARVSEVPDRDGKITRKEFRHALAQVAAAEDLRRAPKPGAPSYERLKRVAVSALLEAVWLKGQAAEMGIVVFHRQVARKLARLKKANFQSAAEYRKFLREARFTRRDVYERVELQLLSVRIQRRIEKRVRDESEEQKVFDEFVTAFNDRWRARTVCAPAYVIARCSNA